MTTERIGIYPGTFDPVTNGHLDIICRATKLVDRLVVAVAVNTGKGPWFSLEERVELVRDSLASHSGLCAPVEVKPFKVLLMDFAVAENATMIVRGLRAVSDFEYEFQMCGMNSRLNATIETVFLMASERCQFISSRFVKEIGRLGGDIEEFVPPCVYARLREKFREFDQSGESVE